MEISTNLGKKLFKKNPNEAQLPRWTPWFWNLHTICRKERVRDLVSWNQLRNTNNHYYQRKPFWTFYWRTDIINGMHVYLSFAYAKTITYWKRRERKKGIIPTFPHQSKSTHNTQHSKILFKSIKTTRFCSPEWNMTLNTDMHVNRTSHWKNESINSYTKRIYTDSTAATVDI